MSIYLTSQVSYATKVEAFNQRGLSNQVAVRACESGVYPITRSSWEVRTRYASLHDELSSRLNGKPQAYSNPPNYVNCLPRFDRFHFEAPTLIVEMKSGGEVLHAYGMYETGTAKMGLYAGKPTSEQVKNIMSLGLEIYSSVPAGNVNLAGYCAYIQAWRGINAFFFAGGGDKSEEDPLMAGISRASVEILSNQLRADPEKTGCIFQTSAMNIAAGVKKHCEPGEIHRIVKPEAQKGFDGFVFPYFREMLTADPDTPFQQFLKLYRYCIATSAEESAQSMELIRRGFRFLASTMPGRVIQHIYFGMDLVIEMGGQLTLCMDGSDYVGFAIQGKNLALLSKNRIKNSFSPDDVETALEALSSHSSAVKTIYESVIAISRFDGAVEMITLEMCINNPRHLRDLIQGRAARDINDLRTILNDNIGHLRYKQTYWEVNAKNIVKFLQLLNQKSEISEEPLYVHIDVLTNRSSDILEYLSVFGAQAPSFYYGNTLKQIANTGEEDPNLRLVNGKRSIPHIPYVKKGLIAAAADWATVKRTHSFKFQGPKRTGENAAYSDTRARDGVIANPDFDTFYPLLRLWSYSGANGQGEISSMKKKRARAEGEDTEMDKGEGSSKKAKVSYSFL